MATVYEYKTPENTTRNVVAVLGTKRVTFAMIDGGVKVKSAPLKETKHMTVIDYPLGKAIASMKRHAKLHDTNTKGLRKFLKRAKSDK